MIPDGYRIRTMEPGDFAAIAAISARVYPNEIPYTVAELAEHHAVYAQGQLVAEHLATRSVAGVQFTLRLRLSDFHIDDPWELLTAHGTFDDHDPVAGMTLYGADIMVSPDHQRHGLAHALTDATRALVMAEHLWRMVGASRLPGDSKVAERMSPADYVAAVVGGRMVDPVLTAHLKDGWAVVRSFYGYLQDDPESANWAAVVQWINPSCPPPPGLALR